MIADIEVDILRKEVKHFNLNVRPTKQVYLSVSQMVSMQDIKGFLLKKHDWIKKQLEFFNSLDTGLEFSDKKYVSGEDYSLFDKRLRLKIIESKEKSIFEDAGFLVLKIPAGESSKLKERMIKSFYEEQTKITFHKALSNVFSLVEKYGYEYPHLYWKKQDLRWGTYIKATNTIILNSYLVFAPKHCIEYVVLHELLHAKNDKHDKAFYSTITTLMPDWKERKNKLDFDIALRIDKKI